VTGSILEVQALTPSSVFAGFDTVTISGYGFLSATTTPAGTTTVTFPGVAAPAVNPTVTPAGNGTPQQLTIKVPALDAVSTSPLTGPITITVTVSDR
jgi:hypothetical protein